MTQDDAWLTRALGFRALIADEPPPREAVTQRTLTTAKVAVDDVARASAFEAVGFGVVDVNVTLTRKGEAAPAAASLVRAAGPADAERVLDIAGSSFRYSRFHLDPALENELADNVKREWARSYVEGSRGLELLVAETGGEVSGFLAVLETENARMIDLIAVASEAQGVGVGAALVTSFTARHASPGRELRVGTQIANAASLRLYARHGFLPVTASYVLHRHDTP
jgi:ribosomal protein S18 acetylase RimI-like enzyme